MIKLLKKLTWSNDTQKDAILAAMNKTQNYEDWLQLALDMDSIRGFDSWKCRDDDPNYNSLRLRERFDRLSRLYDSNYTQGILFQLNEGIHGNMDGMGQSVLHSRSVTGTKQLIEDYVELVCKCLEAIENDPNSDLDFDEKLDFFRRANHCYGSSCLALSGAAGLIYFHHGVVQALIENRLLPQVISGSSAGSWICAQLGCMTDDELENHFIKYRYHIPSFDTFNMSTSNLFDFMRSSIRLRSAYKDEIVEQFVNPSITFQEAYERTGRYINISVAPSEKHQNSRLLNAITSPNVTISSAAKASSSIPGVVNPVQLYAKNYRGSIVKYLPGQLWVDGSVSDDLPFRRLSRVFGINHFIVSMANPVVVPFLSSDSKSPHQTPIRSTKNVLSFALKESIRSLQTLSNHRSNGHFNTLLSIANDLANQQYLGDINISMDPSQISLRRFFFSYKSDEDISSLIDQGKRSTWKKISQIQSSTSISHLLREILERLETQSLREEHKHCKPHMTL